MHQGAKTFSAKKNVPFLCVIDQQQNDASQDLKPVHLSFNPPGLKREKARSSDSRDISKSRHSSKAQKGLVSSLPKKVFTVITPKPTHPFREDE